MATERKLPTADEAGLVMFEKLMGHSGKQRMRELIEPPPAAAAEAPKEDELSIDDLEQMLKEA